MTTSVSRTRASIVLEVDVEWFVPPVPGGVVAFWTDHKVEKRFQVEIKNEIPEETLCKIELCVIGRRWEELQPWLVAWRCARGV
jgi:hypothetical protein